MNNAHTLQRIGAYIIDILLIAFLSVLLTMWIPKSEKYKAAIEEESNLLSDYSDKKINESKYIDRMYEARYTIEKENIVETIVSLVITFGYFSTFAYYNKGQTLGKKLLKIRIVTTDEKEVSHLRLMARAMIIGGCLADLINLVLILIIKSNQYSYTIGIVEIIQSIILFSSLILMVSRKDKRGIHDLLCNTKVIEAQ